MGKFVPYRYFSVADRRDIQFDVAWRYVCNFELAVFVRRGFYFEIAN